MKYKGIIFDLDQTLIDSSAVESLRRVGNWSEVNANLHNTYMHHEMQTVLKELNSTSMKMGIITNSPRMYAERILKYHSVRFDGLIAYHDVLKRKPHPESFLLMLDTLGVVSDECVSIGDHDNDILASRQANILAIGINWHSASYKFKVTPDQICSSPKELLEILRSDKL